MEQQIVVFKLGDQFYAISVYETREIMRMVQITPIPNTDYFTEGIINLRGKVTPIININRMLGLLEKEHDSDTRIIIVEKDNRSLGMIVDAVLEVGKYSEEEMEPPVDDSAEFIQGVIKREDKLWLLLDLNKILN